MSAPDPHADPVLHEDDLDDVVAIASRRAEDEASTIPISDVKSIAAELAIDPKHVEPAIAELADRRARERDARERAHALLRSALRRGATALAALAVFVALGAVSTRSTLAPRWTEVERARSQVESVIARRARVEARFRGRPPSLDGDAELAGAENRVGIERRRYDEAAAAYNAEAAGLPHAWFCGLAGVPCRAPLASELRALDAAETDGPR